MKTVTATRFVIQVQGPLDREAMSSYVLTVQVEDSEGTSASTTVTINIDDVNDNDPTCTVSTAAVAVDEGATTGDVFQPSCSDLVSMICVICS